MFSPLDIIKFLKFTGANGVLVARGAIHNPGIFQHKKLIWEQVNNTDGTLPSELEAVW
jgi:tRNA-dihydrouridine synthase